MSSLGTKTFMKNAPHEEKFLCDLKIVECSDIIRIEIVTVFLETIKLVDKRTKSEQIRKKNNRYFVLFFNRVDTLDERVLTKKKSWYMTLCFCERLKYYERKKVILSGTKNFVHNIKAQLVFFFSFF